MTAPINTTHETPSAARLLRSTMIALGVAILLLVVAVLPAEYGVDPTRIGRVLGLTEMGEIKMQLAREAAAEDAAEAEAALQEAPSATDATPATGSTPTTATTADTGWRDVTIVSLAPNEGKEVKLVMTKDAVAEYSWIAVGGAVNHDTHGDSTNAPNSYHRYARATGVMGDSGRLVAAMDGSHGWFWRNRSATPVSITLRTRGAYTELKKLY